MGPFIGSILTRSRPIYQLFGANTNVGKTVVSTTLCSAIRKRRPNDDVLFLKPVSTGPLEDADDRHINRYVKGITTKCLHQFDEPVSPHLAARGNYKIPSDSEICKSISTTLHDWSRPGGSGFALLETAGGVLSPGPSGSLQADLYRPLRLPIILVADSRIGGISATISAYESLSARGHDVEAIVVFTDEYYRNHEFFGDFARLKDVPLLCITAPPRVPSHTTEAGDDIKAMTEYYRSVLTNPEVTQLLETLQTKHVQRIERLEEMAQKAHEVIWYPFTQHHGMSSGDIAVIDSAHGDCFQTLKPNNKHAITNSRSPEPKDGKCTPLLQPTFDGSASWWTQGLGHGNPELAQTAAYAAGRYGHVMFAGTIHEPALSLAQVLLESSQNPRLQKVFFTDNGSAGMEVALKMGLRATSSRYGWSPAVHGDEIEILGLSGSYHGDTMGVMDCSEPSTFNKKVEWYRGRGAWLDFPKVRMTQGVWMVSIPENMREDLGEDIAFQSLSAIFNLEARKDSDLANRYRAWILATLEDLVVRQRRKLGALIIEPVVLGAGGMIFSDPLFQQILVQTIRQNPQLFSPKRASTTISDTSWTGLPIIFDEVFSGMGRLGRLTASSFLDVHPDITVNSKLLTGGLIPLCTTMASKEIFGAFDSPEKSDALLHGHSYTAHPVGCTVAEYSVRKIRGLTEGEHWNEAMRDWEQERNQQGSQKDPEIWSLWSRELVRDLSFAESVESVFAIGSVLSITLRDRAGTAGYNSTAAAGLQQHLKTGDLGFSVHSRVLGNVLYLMASLTSKRETLENLEGLLRQHLL